VSLYSATVLADNPKAYYRADEIIGSIAHDSSGNNYHAALSGATLNQPGAISGDTDTAMRFTAAGGITLPVTINVDSFTAASLEFWTNVGSGWHYVAITVDSFGTILYVDGVVTTSSAGAAVPLSQALEYAGSYTQDGYLDEIAIYNYTLSPLRITAHYTVGPLTGTYTINVGGSPYIPLAGSLNIMSAIGRRSQASFALRTTTATHVQQYQATAIYDNKGLLIFSGYVSQPKEAKPGYMANLLHDVVCIDQHYLADKRIIVGIYNSQTCGAIVADIVSRYLASEGVTVGQINAGPTINETFNYVTAAIALDTLAARAGFYWQIDQFKQLYFVPYSAIVNPTIIDGSQIDHSKQITVSRGNPNYRNTQYVLGGTAQTASQTETRKGDGTATAFTMGYPFATVPTILVNGTAKTKGIKGVNTSGYDWYWAKGDPILAQDTAGTKLLSTDTLSVTYTGQYATVVIASDVGQITTEAALESTTGIVESVTTDATIQSTADGFALAAQLIARYAATGTILTFWTRQSGFSQGQFVTVNLPAHALNNASMLIESVTATDGSDNLNIWYQITAVMGPYDTTWVAFFATLLASQQAANAINIGVSQQIALLAPFTATWPAWGANLITTVFVCPICGPSTLCANTTIAC